jgi:hypothetical protein
MTRERTLPIRAQLELLRRSKALVGCPILERMHAVVQRDNRNGRGNSEMKSYSRRWRIDRTSDSSSAPSS